MEQICRVDNNPSGRGKAVQQKFLPINALPEDDSVGSKLVALNINFNMF
jgi:hypothetical protein